MIPGVDTVKRIFRRWQPTETNVLAGLVSFVTGAAAVALSSDRVPPSGDHPLTTFVVALAWPLGWALIAYAVLLAIGIAFNAIGRGPKVEFQSPIRLVPRGSNPKGAALDEARSTISKYEETIQRQQADVEAMARQTESFRQNAQEWRERTNRYREALHTVIAWLYRRDHWNGLSTDAKTKEPAPVDYAARKLNDLGIAETSYDDYSPMHAEPGWMPAAPAPGMAGSSGPASERIGDLPDASNGSDRPSRCDSLDTATWLVQRPHFCETLKALIANAAPLTRRLRELPPSAGLPEASELQPLISKFAAQLEQFIATWYVEAPKFPQGETSPLGPGWRKRDLAVVSARLRWLEGEADRTHCEI